jgi:hypothetical protein
MKTMRLALRILFIVAFLGSLFWIYHDPSQPEPYVSTVLAVAALLGTFYDEQRREPNLVPRIIGKTVVRNGSDGIEYALIIHNDGDIEVIDFGLKLILADGQKSPIWDAERKPTDHIFMPVIHAGQRFEWRVVIFFRAPTEFDVIWSWKTKWTRKVERKGRLKLELLSSL